MRPARPRRREILAGGSLGLLGAGFFARVDRVAAMQKSPPLTDQVKKQASGTSEKLPLRPKPIDHKSTPRTGILKSCIGLERP